MSFFNKNNFTKFFNLLMLFLIVIVLTPQCKSDIIADPTVPIKVIPPNLASLVDNGTTIEINFSVNNGFYGLYTGQAISMQFNGSSGVFMENYYTCSLEVKDSLNNIVGLKVKTVAPSSNDQKSVFCVIDDEPYLPTISGVETYTFKVTLVIKQSIPVHKIRSVWIAFTTSTDLYRMFIHPAQLVSATPNYDTGIEENKIMTINELSKENLTPPPDATHCPDPCGLLYPDSIFKITVTLTVNHFFQTKSEQKAVLAISWANTNFDFDNATILSENGVVGSTDLLDGSLLPTTGQTIALEKHLEIPMTRKISNVGENMYKNRKFKLIISGVKAPDYVTTTAENDVAHLNFMIYHTNDYARFGIVSTKDYITEPIFKTNTYKISFTPLSTSTTPTADNDPPTDWKGIAHPEFMDIYENASWPMRFIFNLPPMPSGGYVRIEHEYTDNQIFNFIASTCDFSDGQSNSSVNSIFSGILGQRPICFPTNTILTQRDTNSNVTSESGLYFKVPITNNFNTVSVIIWGFASKCSENDYLSELGSYTLNIYGSTERAKNSKQYSFNIKAYKKIDQSLSTLFAEADLVGQSDSIPMYGNCHGTIIGHNTSHSNYSIEPFYSDPSLVSATSDVLLYKEFYDWNLADKSAADGDFNFLDSTKYYYLLTNSADKDGVEFGVPLSNIMEAPIPGYINSGALTLFTDNIIKFYISRGFMKSDTAQATCILRWYNSDLGSASTGDVGNILSVGGGTDYQKFDTTEDLANHIKNTFIPADDTGFAYPAQPQAFHYPIIISSIKLGNAGDALTNSRFVDSLTSQNLGFFTDCAKVNNGIAASDRKSIYSYLEFNYTFSRQDVDSNYFVNRAARFVKLYPSIGGFNDPADQVTITSNHTFYYAFSTNYDDLCLLRINSSTFYSTNDDTIIALVLINIRLLVIDSNDLSTVYPVTPTATGVSVYAESTVYPFSFIDAKTHTSILNRQYNSQYSPIANPYTYSDYVKNPANNDIYNYFGSVIYFYNSAADDKFTSATDPQIDTYIPVYCPKGGEMIDNKDHLSFVVPSVSAFSFSLDSNNSWTVSTKATNIKYDLNSGSSDGIGNVSLLFKRSILEPASSDLTNVINLYYSQHSIESTLGTHRLYVKGSVPVGGIPPETRCSSMTLFMTDLIIPDSSITFDSKTISAKYSNSKGFYFKNKYFTQAMYYGINSGDDRIFIPGTVDLTDEYNSFIGIQRPNLATYTSTNNNLTDDISFQCVRVSSAGDGAGIYYNNYNTTNQTFDISFLKLNQDDTNWVFTLSNETTYTTPFENDPAYQLNINIQIDSSLPTLGNIELKSSQLTTTAICAINNANNNFPATMCNAIASNTLVCPLSNSALQVINPEILQICCYNLLVTANTEIVFDNKDTKISLDSHNFSTSFLYKDPSTGTPDDEIQIDTEFFPNTSTTALSTLAEIKSFLHQQVSQDGGLGILMIDVDLIRGVVPNQRIRIKGGLSDYFIDQFSPKCEFIYHNIASPTSTNLLQLIYGKYDQVNTFYEDGNYLADKCVIDTSNADKNEHTLDLYNKNIIYKCGLTVTLATKVAIYLSPAKYTDISSLTYTLQSGVTDFETANYIVSAKTTTFPAPTYTQSASINQKAEVCNVFNILPSLIGSNADYIFKIDLSSFTSYTNNPNEISIFFETLIFPYPNADQMNNVACYLNDSSSVISWCNWERNGFFNIGFNFNLSAGVIYYLKITNVINATLDPEFEFHCSINKYTAPYDNTDPDKRVIEILGTGTNEYANYFDLVRPDNAVYEVIQDYQGPYSTPYLIITGPDTDSKYIVKHSSDALEEQYTTKVYYLYNNAGSLTPTEQTMLDNFNAAKTVYQNNFLTTATIEFHSINVGDASVVADNGATLSEGFVMPSYRILTTNWRQYSDTSDGSELENFISDSINDFYYNYVWPYLYTFEENSIRHIRLDYARPRDLPVKAEVYLFYLSTDTSSLKTHLESTFDACTYDTSLANYPVGNKVSLTDGLYKLTNINEFSLPSIRVVLPNGVMKTLNVETKSLDDFLTETFTSYFYYDENIPDLLVPIYKPKLFLFTYSSTTDGAGDDVIDDQNNCKMKYAQDLQASFYQYKTYYNSLTVLSSKEIEFVDLDVNNATCGGPVDFDSNVWPSVVFYLPEGKKFTYTPSVPDTSTNGNVCDHYNHYWDIKHLVDAALKFYISKDDLIFNQLPSHDAAVVFIGNSSKDHDVFKNVIINSSIYLPYYYCTLKECMTEFNVSNGDVLFFNSNKEPYSVTTDVKVLANTYTTVQLTKFMRDSYNPEISEVNSEIMYQVFYKRRTAIYISLKNDATASGFLDTADLIAKELRNSVLVVTNVEDGREDDLLMKKKLKYTRAASNNDPVIYILDSITIFKRFLMTTSYTKENVVSFYDSWREGNLTPEATSEALPNYTELISNVDSVTGSVLPIVRSNFDSRAKGDDDDVVIVFINDHIDYNNIVMMYFLEVAKYYSSRAPRMQFYKINLSQNDLPELDIEENSRLPAIRIYTKRNSKSIPYDFHEDINNYIESVKNIKTFIEFYKFHPLIN